MKGCISEYCTTGTDSRGCYGGVKSRTHIDKVEQDGGEERDVVEEATGRLCEGEVAKREMKTRSFRIPSLLLFPAGVQAEQEKKVCRGVRVYRSICVLDDFRFAICIFAFGRPCYVSRDKGRRGAGGSIPSKDFLSAHINRGRGQIHERWTGGKEM